MSKPDAPGVIRASIVVVSHFGHGSPERGNMFASPCIRRERYRALSHRADTVEGPVMGHSMQPFADASLCCFAHV
jgi:hypothetical protein